MNKIKILLITALVGITFNSFSQEMTEKEKKILKKEMLKKAKETDALLLKDMYEKYPELLKKDEE